MAKKHNADQSPDKVSSAKQTPVNVMRNDPFPIHVNFTHKDADFDKSKPGGIFTKKLYREEQKVNIASDVMPVMTPRSDSSDHSCVFEHASGNR